MRASLIVDPTLQGELKVTKNPFESLSTLLANVADSHLRIIADILEARRPLSSQSKASDGTVVSERDTSAHQAISGILESHTPGTPILSEETELQTPAEFCMQLKGERYCWIVDPIDGSQNLIQGSPCFASSIALCEIREGAIFPIAASVLFPGHCKGVVCDGSSVRINELIKDPSGLWRCSKLGSAVRLKNPSVLQHMSLFSSYDFSKRYEIDPSFEPALRILRSTVVDFVSVATGVPEGWGVGAFTYAKIWDIAAGIAIGKTLGMSLSSFEDGRIISGLRPSDFKEDPRDRWGVLHPVIFGYPENLEFIRSLVTKK